jgi:hypothetical protein
MKEEGSMNDYSIVNILRFGYSLMTILCWVGLFIRLKKAEKGYFKDYVVLIIFTVASVLFQYPLGSDQFGLAVSISLAMVIVTILDVLWWFLKIIYEAIAKQSIKCQVMTIALSLCVVFTSTLYVYAKPPNFRESDGSSSWKVVIPVIKRSSLISFDTRANVFWNGSSIEIGGSKVAQNKWLELMLWNGLGITEVQIIGQQSGEKLFPKAKIKADSMKFENEDLKIAFQLEPSRSYNSRYQLVSLKPTSIDKAVVIKVRDKLGNISSSALSI